MSRWVTCGFCGEAVEVLVTPDDTARHTCPPEPILTTAQHIQYHKAHVINVPEEKNGKDVQSSRS